jgi:hypothetical protein
MVSFYSSKDQSGFLKTLLAGSYPNLASAGVGDDTVDSISIHPYTKITIYSENNYGGYSLVLSNWDGASNKYVNLIDYGGCGNCSWNGTTTTWDDEASSVVIQSRSTDCLTSYYSQMYDSGICDSVCDSNTTYKSQCASTKSAYCSNIANITTDFCNKSYTWAKTNGFNVSTYDAAWRDYCTVSSARLASDPCVNYYRNNYNTMTYLSEFENAWEDYCTTGGGQSNPKCACFTSSRRPG